MIKEKQYQKFKKLLYLAKQTFLNDKGMEVEPNDEKLEELIGKMLELIGELKRV